MTDQLEQLRDKIRAAWPEHALTHGRGTPVPPVRDGGNTAACIDLAVELSAEHFTPRTITTMAEVLALPAETLIRTKHGEVAEFYEDRPSTKWRPATFLGSVLDGMIVASDLPALVLWTPGGGQ
ncbi:hypothetical protein [Rhodococcus zopfii]|uniref:hypothetical protein n=1 Tax=Rhodococcus zopfii TaxID=43772 RepID=UPI0009348E1D|nr:hypothetical protein [Rhodococcus zopfii]